MALTENRDVDHYIDQEIRTLRVAGAAHIYKGAFVGLAETGYARPLLAGDKFVGLAYDEADNTAGGDAATTVRVYTLGDFGHPLAGATAADTGRPVFASDDETLTFDATGNSFVGLAQDVSSAGEVILRLDPDRRHVRTITFVVDDLAAGTDLPTRAIHAFSAEGWIVAARAVNQDTTATGISSGSTCVVTLAINAGTIVTETFDSSNVFPAINEASELGPLACVHAASGDILTLTVTNGATADPGPFLVQVDIV